VVAVAAMAFAVPGIASAGYWAQEGEPLEETHFLDFDGSLVFDGSYFTQIQCDVSGQMTIESEGEGEINEFNFDSCGGTWGYTSCYSEGGTVDTPWPMELVADSGNQGKIIIHNAHYKITWDDDQPQECLVDYMQSSESGLELTLTPNNSAAISKFSAKGLTWSFPYVSYGTLELSNPAEHGLYGFYA
jgi:hypothetical protein